VTGVGSVDALVVSQLNCILCEVAMYRKSLLPVAKFGDLYSSSIVPFEAGAAQTPDAGNGLNELSIFVTTLVEVITVPPCLTWKTTGTALPNCAGVLRGWIVTL
jgi:hypothetical protein